MYKNGFKVDQKYLAGVLSSMQPICSKRTTIESTTSILFHPGRNELVLKSTDLEISLQYSCKIKESNIDEDKTFLVSGKRVFDLIKELEGEVEFGVKNQQIFLNSNGVKLSLNIKDAEEFPPFPERIENLMQIDSKALLGMLEKVSFLIPQNNSNPALNGLFVEISDRDLKMTATDGHCLAQAISYDYKLDKPQNWLLPRRAVFELKKIVESAEDKSIFLGVCGNQLVFSGESFNFFTKLLVDSFPQYQQILNKDGFQTTSISKPALVKALRRSVCLLSGKFIATQFNFKDTKLNLCLQNKEVGELEEELSLGESLETPLDIRFYAPYLASGLQVFSKDDIKFYLNGASQPILFDAEEDGISFTYLTMPVSPAANS